MLLLKFPLYINSRGGENGDDVYYKLYGFVCHHKDLSLGDSVPTTHIHYSLELEWKYLQRVGRRCKITQFFNSSFVDAQNFNTI